MAFWLYVDGLLRRLEAGQKSVAAHGVISSVSRALIRSPLTDRSARRRICAGSAWLFRYMTKVLSFENRLMASGLCEVIIRFVPETKNRFTDGTRSNYQGSDKKTLLTV